MPDPVETAVLGRTGRVVSRIGFGGATAGLKNYLGAFDPAQGADRDRVLAAIQRALELGITYFDTAPGYGDGASESLFGEGLAGAAEDRIFLATKAGAWKETDVRASLEASLKRLRRGRIDLLQIHGTVYTEEIADRVLRKGGMLDQIERLRGEGLVRHIGFTVEALNPQAFQLAGSGRFDVVQILYNFLFQHPCDPKWKTGILYECEARGMGIVTMRATTSSVFHRWVQRVNPANTFDYTPALIQFPLANPLVDVVLIGTRSARRVEENLAIAARTGERPSLDDLFQMYV